GSSVAIEEGRDESFRAPRRRAEDPRRSKVGTGWILRRASGGSQSPRERRDPHGEHRFLQQRSPRPDSPSVELGGEVAQVKTSTVMPGKRRSWASLVRNRPQRSSTAAARCNASSGLSLSIARMCAAHSQTAAVRENTLKPGSLKKVR